MSSCAGSLRDAQWPAGDEANPFVRYRIAPRRARPSRRATPTSSTIVQRLDDAVAERRRRRLLVTPFAAERVARRVGEGRDGQRRWVAQGPPPHGTGDLARGRARSTAHGPSPSPAVATRPSPPRSSQGRRLDPCTVFVPTWADAARRRSACASSAPRSRCARGTTTIRRATRACTDSARRSPPARSRSRAKGPTTASRSTAAARSATRSPTPASPSTT